MNYFFHTAIVMEMLIINLFTVDICATRKYSRFTTTASLIVFTILLNLLTQGLWSPMGFEDGNAAFALIGIVYLFPLNLLYQERLPHLLSILFSAWIYTMVVYCLSVRIADMGITNQMVTSTLLAQSLIYILTFYGFIYWIQKGFLFILRNITQSNRYLLQLVSLCWFISIIIVNANLIYTNSQLLKAASMLTLAVNAFLSYLLIFSMVKSHKELRNLEDIVYLDYLTQLYNRSRLFKDIPRLIEQRIRFRLFFIDLNHFKSVNDQHGHMVGDQYLICFSNQTLAMLSKHETLYRMSGDEFIIISRAKDYQPVTDKLKHYPPALKGMDIPFLGLSLGWADYPEEGSQLDDLIAIADHRMYLDKHPKKSPVS